MSQIPVLVNIILYYMLLDELQKGNNLEKLSRGQILIIGSGKPIQVEQLAVASC